ncbi:hypothetical protein EGK75_09140 [Neisseria weixii]|uniref:Uncharacterized protein n=1 Tax=Neisseria weixii TaxID=1853276 RepID=A0A3N4MZJ4_9NEIS|nr:HeH/LEM domain-containing protein [Neisseria weixii]RPD86276.1 hypothetical protein EGK75_09140 [Neisseria weixii]RPD89404.1 hypothetical protein EGK74_04075 [Neisseria weixii]
MSKEREIVYEPHPVSHERKAELLAQGKCIVDAKFAPEGYEPPKNENQNAPGSVAKLKEALEQLGVDIPEGAKKADLQKLYAESTGHA